MHYFVTAWLALSSLSAWAWPVVGTQATYRGTLGGQAGTMVTEVIAQAANGDQTVRSTLTAGGRTQVETGVVEAANIPTEANLRMILGYCSQMGGTNDRVTVPAGTFDTCYLVQGDSHTHLGVVPFGAVKASGITEDGVPFDYELVSYKLR